MLTPDYLDALPGPIVDLYEEYQTSIINDIARRLAKMKLSSAAWQVQRLSESGALYEGILARLASLSGNSEAVLQEMFKNAGVKALKFDDSVYKAAGLNPLPLNLSPAMIQVLTAGLQKTNALMHNLTLTTALTGQEAFVSAVDLAYMQVSTGSMSYTQAIREAIKEVAGQGLDVIHFASGRHDQLDVAMRRTVLTGVAQTTGIMQMTRADEMGCDLVQATAHAGARPTHQIWQGQIFSRSGGDAQYPPFVESTGYGSVTGLCGANCRHHFYPFFKGISENAYKQATLDEMAGKTVKYNGKQMSQYDASQVQRGIERQIRKAKREAGALEAAGLANHDEVGQVKALQAQMRDFVKQTGLKRQGVREGGRVVKSVPRKYQSADFYSGKSSTIGRTPDLKKHFPEGTPGREFITSNDVELLPKRKEHITDNHKEQIPWLENNNEVIQKAISTPTYIDATPFRDKGRWAATHIVEVTHENYDFLIVGIKHGKEITENHEVLTMFLADKRFVFDDQGNIKPRWLKIK